MAKDLMHVRVNSPEKILWEGEAEFVTSENSKGPFDILPMHTNFISYIENKPIKIKTEKGIETYQFPWSVIYAHSNNVYIYTNI
jgi:F0F1-type ATP synthase epsilon subunit